MNFIVLLFTSYLIFLVEDSEVSIHGLWVIMKKKTYHLMSYSPMHIFRQTHTHMHELNYWWDLCHVSMYRGEKGRTLPWWLNPLMMDWTHIFNLVFDHQILFSFMLAFWGTTGSMEELDVSRYSGSHFLYLLKSCLWNVNILSINICIFLLMNGVYLFKTICW